MLRVDRGEPLIERRQLPVGPSGRSTNGNGPSTWARVSSGGLDAARMATQPSRIWLSGRRRRRPARASGGRGPSLLRPRSRCRSIMLSSSATRSSEAGRSSRIDDRCARAERVRRPSRTRAVDLVRDRPRPMRTDDGQDQAARRADDGDDLRAQLRPARPRRGGAAVRAAASRGRRVRRWVQARAGFRVRHRCAPCVDAGGRERTRGAVMGRSSGRSPAGVRRRRGARRAQRSGRPPTPASRPGRPGRARTNRRTPTVDDGGAQQQAGRHIDHADLDSALMRNAAAMPRAPVSAFQPAIAADRSRASSGR